MSTLVERVERQPTSGMSDGIGEWPGFCEAVVSFSSTSANSGRSVSV